MTKYARFVWRNNESDHSIHLVDVVDVTAACPRLPLIGCETEQQLLSKLFEPNKTQWVADDEWFQIVPNDVESGDTFVGIWPQDQMDSTKYERGGER